MKLIKDINLACKYIDEQRPMTVAEWKTAKDMYRRATVMLKRIVKICETKEDLINKIQHLNCFSMRNRRDYEHSYDYLDLEYKENNSKSVEYILVTITLQYISTMFNVAIKHLDYEYETLTLNEVIKL